MTRNLHRHSFWNRRSDHVPYGSSPEIMEDLGGDLQFRALFIFDQISMFVFQDLKSPARIQALSHESLKSLTGWPFRWKTKRHPNWSDAASLKTLHHSGKMNPT